MPSRPLKLPVTTSPRASAPAVDEPLGLLGGLTPAQFMRRYWQRKPLLIRQAFSPRCAPLDRESLFALASSDDVESRLVTRSRGRWRLDHGPFDAADLPGPRARLWTLLVQGVNLHNEAARALLDQFRFIPDARVDDLMISYAADGGGVGPHVDSYDVFLLQAEGRRRWRISTGGSRALQPGQPLKVLQDFEAREEWVLEPGDMLYLPPQVAHEGTAERECMTCSIGFRAPRAAELTSQFLYYLAERAAEQSGAGGNKLYSDAGQPPATEPARIPRHLVSEVGAILASVKWSDRDISTFLGAYLSEPKATVFFDSPPRPVSSQEFLRRIALRGVRLDRRTSLLYDPDGFYINGEKCSIGKNARVLGQIVRRLADERSLDRMVFVTLAHDSPVTALLYEWYCAGWIRIA